MLAYDKGSRKPVGFARPARRKRSAQGGSPRLAKPNDVAKSPPNRPKAVNKKHRHTVQTEQVPSFRDLTNVERPTRPEASYGHHPPMQWIESQHISRSLSLPRRVAKPKDMDDQASVVSAKLDDVLTAIDQGAFSGSAGDLTVNISQLEDVLEPQSRSTQSTPPQVSLRKLQPRGNALNPFTKVDFYANSRLPKDLPPLKLYLPAWPLICLAAQYAERVYVKPKREERHTHIMPDWKGKEKAMVIRSVPVDHMNVIVFAIRGTQSFRDWATNFNASPVSSIGFLGDPANFCHAGFLDVAKKMVSPVATRLRRLLEDNPARSCCSLVITGHSAGGAVAALLFCHMLQTSASSDLTSLSHSFKRIHCFTFGAPPVAGLPLSKPQSWQHRKSMFLSFVNEGDPVTRADPAYVRSLLDLYTTPAPPRTSLPVDKSTEAKPGGPWRRLKLNLPSSGNQEKISPIRSGPHWPVPSCSFSNAGRIVVLRQRPDFSDGGISAVTATDQRLRGSVFGDPLMHMMRIYRERVEKLASQAITGGAWS